VAVPALRGESERQARLRLEDLELLPGDLLRVSGDEPAGRVLSSRPGPGVRVPLGARIDLLLSQGPAGPDFLVPDLRRKELPEVLALLDAHGIEEPEIRYRTGHGSGERILEQSPPPGSRLEQGRVLELVVASQSR
jgi:beta-lactam-binding protein with PASTA domain